MCSYGLCATQEVSYGSCRSCRSCRSHRSYGSYRVSLALFPSAAANQREPCAFEGGWGTWNVKALMGTRMAEMPGAAREGAGKGRMEECGYGQVGSTSRTATSSSTTGTAVGAWSPTPRLCARTHQCWLGTAPSSQLLPCTARCQQQGQEGALPRLMVRSS